MYVAAALYRISRPGAGIHQKHQFGTALAERQFRLSGVRYGDPRTARVDHEREHAARTAVHGAAVLQPHSRGTVLLVFIPTVWFYYSAVRKRLHRYGVQENEAQREKARTVVETFRGYADLEINDAFPSMLRRFDRAMDKIVTIQSRNMTVNALPSILWR
mgnify:CR=1 FL=1